MLGIYTCRTEAIEIKGLTMPHRLGSTTVLTTTVLTTDSALLFLIIFGS